MGSHLSTFDCPLRNPPMGGGGGGGGAAGADTTDGPWFVDKEIGSLPLLFSEVVSGRNFCSWNANNKTGINNNSQYQIMPIQIFLLYFYNIHV